ncbi:DUF885 domain-containing protein [Aestuariibacter sp. AA17]|uniref:DUF885 domain-containing protein n=1 Tax=Fluctibacter corallii TaxID=2984329 RepID=A0ABT3AC03_9ALTE|nr:DUF885 domain-containing protein [Aestuariibacter sp. AA17]MCV2886145.1 DUF885 domain-containing protein [Aestuariibacter sp. AA17]
MKRLLMIFLSLVAIPINATPSSEFAKLIDEIWQFEMQADPILATSKGVHVHNDKLKDLSPEGLAKTHQQYQRYLDALAKVETKKLSRNEQITLSVQTLRLQNHVDKYQFKKHYLPFTSESGFHSKFARLPSKAPFNNVQDYQNYLTRLSAFPEFMDQQIHWLTEGMKVGMVQPKVTLTGLDDSVASFFSGKPSESVFYTPFTDIEKVVGQAQADALKKQALEVIENDIFTAYRRFHQFLQQTYIPNAKKEISTTSWENGLAYYENRARYFTTTTLSAEEIHHIGLKEVARIRSEMQAVLDEVQFDGSINEFIAFLRTDPQFYAKTPLELIKHASYFSKLMDAKLPKLFNVLPRTPYGVEAVPDSIAPKYTTGRYLGPSREGEPGYYWVNTYALDKRPLYAIPALTLHEAVPGHHLQNALAREMEDLPPVRRFTYISAFGEGWGLYSEYLGKEVGIYANPYDEFGRLSYDMWRACRLVVDTGMHIKGWSRQQAIDYMLENTALSELNVISEIDRYISWPAQALSYKIGELEIRKLRKMAETQLGEKFDVRRFHDAVLAHGSVPLSTLKENIRLFIATEQSK